MLYREVEVTKIRKILVSKERSRSFRLQPQLQTGDYTTENALSGMGILLEEFQSTTAPDMDDLASILLVAFRISETKRTYGDIVNLQPQCLLGRSIASTIAKMTTYEIRTYMEREVQM